jgi:hypothetical protein
MTAEERLVALEKRVRAAGNACHSELDGAIREWFRRGWDRASHDASVVGPLFKDAVSE